MAPSAQVPQRNSYPRPALPTNEYNNKLKEVAAGSGTPPVKFQIILREGQEIVVGRIKVPTPQGHAFILRRFDTGAISLSTMFRACYPTANDIAEKEETAWVKSTFETQGSNGGGKLRLAGTWVPPNVAMLLAESYGLNHILPALANAAPESRSTYRKNGAQNNTPSKGGMHGSPSAAAVANGVVNGVGAAASALIPTSLPPIPSSPAKSAVKKNEDSPSRQPPAKKARKSASPAPASLKALTLPVRSSPRRQAKIQEEEEEEPDVPAPNPDQDIQEAKEEVARLRVEHLAAQAHREVAEAEAEQAQQQTPSKKRGIEATATPPFKLDMAKIQEASENAAMELIPARPIINRRRLGNLQPTQKAAAWGGLAFFIGLGASALIPTLLPGGGLW
ncbi:hypothetical protein FRB94_009252 [Tulasnella sp. JGI-2019a]|nr:hypothetical protein FRB94_009252 [Tulasnella sp. JGI-2019a]